MMGVHTGAEFPAVFAAVQSPGALSGFHIAGRLPERYAGVAQCFGIYVSSDVAQDQYSTSAVFLDHSSASKD